MSVYDPGNYKFAKSKNARKELGDSFDITNEIIEEDLDTMIELIREDDETLYGDYQAARLINDV